MGEEAISVALLPFALHFGLVSEDSMPLAQFAHAWVRAFGDLPGWRLVRPPRTAYEIYDADLNEPLYGHVSWALDGGW